MALAGMFGQELKAQCAGGWMRRVGVIPSSENVDPSRLALSASFGFSGENRVSGLGASRSREPAVEFHSCARAVLSRSTIRGKARSRMPVYPRSSRIRVSAMSFSFFKYGFPRYLFSASGWVLPPRSFRFRPPGVDTFRSGLWAGNRCSSNSSLECEICENSVPCALYVLCPRKCSALPSWECAYSTPLCGWCKSRTRL